MELLKYLKGLAEIKGRAPRVGFFGLGRTARGLIEAIPKDFPCEITLREEKLSHFEHNFPSARELYGSDALSSAWEDVIFFAPSVRRERPELDGLTKSGAQITSDCEIFFARLEKDVFAISGSDGKSTTTALASQLLSASGKKATPCGNYGLPFCSLTEEDGIPVAELSSFNLRYLKPRLYRSVITNITPNHLNWHKDFEEYKQAKAKLFFGAVEPVICADDDYLLSLGERYGAYGVYSTKHTLMELKRRVRAQVYITVEGKWALLNGERLFSRSDMLRREDYIFSNMLGAVALTEGHTDRSAALKVANSFGGLAHRMETVAIKDGVRYINSSIDTSPARTAATLKELQGKVRIILGGRDKGLPKAPLLDAMANGVVKIALYSEAADAIEEALALDGRFSDISREKFEGLAEAIDFAMKDAKDGDTVLLSPSATAYGEFKDFAERGEYFTQYIKDRLSK